VFCSDVVSHGCLEQMVRNGISMGVGLRPKAKAMEKPPNPKESLWASLVTHWYYCSAVGAIWVASKTAGPNIKE